MQQVRKYERKHQNKGWKGYTKHLKCNCDIELQNNVEKGRITCLEHFFSITTLFSIIHVVCFVHHVNVKQKHIHILLPYTLHYFLILKFLSQ